MRSKIFVIYSLTFDICSLNKGLWFVVGYWVIKLVSKILCCLPVSWQQKIGNILGNIAVKFCPSWRMDMARANIRECLGVDAEQADKIAKDSVKRFGRMVVEVLCFPNLNKNNILDHVELEGIEHLKAAHSLDKGVVMVTGHFGNWEMLGAIVALLGYPLVSIVRHQNQGSMNRLINEYREKVGQTIAYNRGGNNLLQIVRMLKNKLVIGVIYDQDTNDIGVKLDLFGKTCIVPDGAASLSRMNQAPIVPIFIHNRDNGKFYVKIYPALFCKDKTDYDRVMKELVVVLEQEVREDPGMWFWVHDRWKDGHQRFDKEYDENKHGHHP